MTECLFVFSTLYFSLVLWFVIHVSFLQLSPHWHACTSAYDISNSLFYLKAEIFPLVNSFDFTSLVTLLSPKIWKINGQNLHNPSEIPVSISVERLCHIFGILVSHFTPLIDAHIL